MSTDDGQQEREESPEGVDVTDGDDDGVRDRLEDGADRAVERFDEGVVDLLSWILDTETRARIFVYLRQHPPSTSDEVADGTGLYPSTVREALAELHEEDTVHREKRESSGAGNNPYEYEAIAPSELVRGVVGDVQRELNAVFNLDRRLGGESTDGDAEPVQISVDDDEESEGGHESAADHESPPDHGSGETDEA